MKKVIAALVLIGVWGVTTIRKEKRKVEEIHRIKSRAVGVGGTDGYCKRTPKK